MKQGDKVLVRRSQQLVEVHEVDGAHITVRWVNPATQSTESRVYPEYELEMAPPPEAPAETKPTEPETKPPADETPKAKGKKK